MSTCSESAGIDQARRNSASATSPLGATSNGWAILAGLAAVRFQLLQLADGLPDLEYRHLDFARRCIGEVQADAVSVFSRCREHIAVRHLYVLGFEQLVEGIDVELFGQFDPERKAPLGLADAGARREIAVDPLAHQVAIAFV